MTQTAPTSIDLNADLGEGAGTDQELMPLISSANIACGGHAGDEQTIRESIKLALANNVAIGAHPGFEDKENFGRDRLDLSFEELRDQLLRQLERFQIIAEEEGAKIRYVKVHGALANMACEDAEIADRVMRVIKEFDPEMPVLALASTEQTMAAIRHGLPAYDEAYADRAFTFEGHLAPRDMKGAVLHDIDQAIAHVENIVHKQGVLAMDGSYVPLKAHSICVHGDSPDAVEMVQAIVHTLKQQDIEIRSFLDVQGDN
ncbi:5-oxoprolinase subunit PxpA [Maritalea mediterranea]|uniref:LamB/YcsF family protein n=1 Tax=Maritalea mediterranea TaxID=2909667 RepID=A0ABS9E6C4_9HYPH|nr:5-oxoprolinase subunit PxpA [Maritalea mediterranea]MCF4098338.1 LamB/YcsF family protein [Maritalea mediterranea]